jgi:ribosomal protein L11 methyltransferase
MDYTKTTINISPAEDWIRDVIAAQLAEIGYESFVETETGLEAFIPKERFKNDDFNMVLNEYRTTFYFSVSQETIKDQNWNQVWEKNYFKPLVISDKCVVRAPFHSEYPKAEYEIIIEPNMAFGTGNHETTSMMLEYILENDFAGKSVLDMGCGTGILGILASMKGAKKVTAIDIDEWSYNGAKDNAQLNNINNIEVKLGDASLLGDEEYDFIFANIQRNVLIADMPKYSNCLNKNGKIFLSGYFEDDKNDIKVAAENQDLTDAGLKIKNNWVAHSFSK